MAKFENRPKDITPGVMDLWPLFCHYTFLTLETKSGMSFIEIGPQTEVIKQNAFKFFENLPRDITPRVLDPLPLFQYTRYIQSFTMFIQTLAFIVPEKSVTKIFKNGKIENISRDITARVMGPWPPFCHYTFLTLETKCGIRFIEVGPQT